MRKAIEQDRNPMGLLSVELRKNMKSCKLQTQYDERRQEAINLVLVAALNKSARAGFGLALLDYQGKLLSSGSAIIGKSELTEMIVEHLQSHFLNVYELIMTGDPVAAMFDLGEFLPALSESSCQKITIGYHSTLLAARDWQAWCSTWTGEVNYLPLTRITEMLHAGPEKMQTSGKPWITSVSAGTIGHQPLKLSDLSHEFGFNAYLKQISMQCHSVLYTPSQEDILPVIEQSVLNGEKQRFYRVDSVTAVSKALKQLSHENRNCTLFLCDIGFLREVIKHDLCDEIIHHIGFNATKLTGVESPPMETPFENWSILSCDTLGQCIRLTLIPEIQEKSISEILSGRLN